MLALSRTTDKFKFYSPVYASREEAEKAVSVHFHEIIKTQTAHGDPADGWMVRSGFGWVETKQVEVTNETI